ncbi:MAG TPA: TonB-dependent receptor [Candidatus Polarisedimenticolia bacterium]|nr:TonB-dependent receptor [Candidatus Polarisedimenticolia bacterium]
MGDYGLRRLLYIGMGWLLILLMSGTIQIFGQTATGGVLGTVTDPSGAVIPGVTIILESVSRGFSTVVTTSSSGTYAFLAVEPGDYLLRFNGLNFQPQEISVRIQVGQTVNINRQMQLGANKTTVQVDTELPEVNTAQAIVQDVINSGDIKAVPLNGRNFMDLAQLNPGIQIQDGGNIDPTKNGFTGISVQGRTGRSTRLELDGIDITDETVGSTTINISLDSIQEFQVAQSSLDPATTLTSTGAVQVITRSGQNTIHGGAFYLFRNNSMAARLTDQQAAFDRSQVGFRVGGPFVKNKLFWFVNYEHTLQHGTTFTAPPAPFQGFSGAFSTPFHETMATGRGDWILGKGWRAFYSFHYDDFSVLTGFGGNFLQPFLTKNLNRVNTAAVDGSVGRMTHSFRFGYMRFQDQIGDGVSSVPGLPAPFTGGESAGITLGNDPLCFVGTDHLCLGPNQAGDQAALQRNLEFRYDGATVLRNHTLRFGGQFIQIPEVVLFNGAGLGPLLNSNVTQTETSFAQTGPFPGGASNPLNYPLEVAVFGNGLPYFSQNSGLGFPRGAYTGRRYALYVQDVWKLKPNLTLNTAVRYSVNTGRTNSDLRGFGVLDPILPGAGSPVRQPYKDFAPQFGFAWDPFKDGKTSIRAGVGVYYDDPTFSLLLFDRTLKIPIGLGNSMPSVSAASPFLAGPNVDLSSAFGQPIGLAVGQIVAAQQALQAFSLNAANNFNPNGTPAFLDPNGDDFNSFGGLIDPKYHSPYSTQINVGMQRQIGKSLVASVDYLHNTNVHSPLSHDANLVGATSTFNEASANAAIVATENAFGCTTIDCAIKNKATILDFASHGLGSPASGLNSQFVSPGNGFAFGGLSQQFGQIGTVSWIGRGTYNALQVRLQQTLMRPTRGVRSLFWTANYSLSRFTSMVSDQDNPFGNFIAAKDNINLSRYEGPNGLDRTNMFTFMASMELPAGVKASVLTRVYSGLPATLSLPLSCSCAAEIFRTDLTGDGTGGDVLPGTNLGSFGRSVKLGDINKVISKFDSTVAGGFTPAGQKLIDSGLFTASQLTALGAVIPSIPLAPGGQVGIDNFVADDIRLSWRVPNHLLHIPENIDLEPTLDVFNFVNKANFDPPNGISTSTLSGVLGGEPGSLNGTTSSERTNRYGLGSGVFSQGIPRAIQIGLQIAF